MKNSILLNVVIILILSFLCFSCGKDKQTQQSSQQQNNSELSQDHSNYPGIIQVKKEIFTWPIFEHAPLITATRSCDMQETHAVIVYAKLTIDGPYTVNYNNLDMSLTLKSLVGPKDSIINADNLNISSKDISRFEGTLKCKHKCILRTATPISKFKMKLDGKFTVYLIDETP